MSRTNRSRALFAATAALLGASSFGCWEQLDDGEWFPQMKRQQAVQAFEANPYVATQGGLMPAEGSVPVGAAEVVDLTQLSIPEQEAIPNPVPRSLASMKNGELLFQRYCATCHGPGGEGNGPVAGPPFGTGPLGLVLPIGGGMSVAKGLTDGHIYTTISMGRGRMPNYRRIPPEERWDVVNYLRELNGQGGQP